MTQQQLPTGAPGSPDTMSVFNGRTLIRAFMKRKWIVLGCILVVGVSTALGTLKQRKIYMAEAQITINPVLPKIMGENDSFENLSELARAERVFNNTQFETIRSRLVLRKATAALGLTQDSNFKEDYDIGPNVSDELEAVVDALLLRLSVEPQQGSRVVRIIFEDFAPERAAKISNAIADAYMEHTLDRRLDTTRKAHGWLDVRVGEYEKKLEKAEEALLLFKQENSLLSVSMESRQNMITARLETQNKRLAEVRAELVEKRAHLNVIRQAKDGDGWDSMPEIADSAVITELRSKLASLKEKRAEIGARYGTKHSAWLEIVAQVNEIEGLLKSEANSSIRALSKEVLALTQTEIGLAKLIEAEKREGQAFNILGVKYAQLSRDYGNMEKTYLDLQSRQNQADLPTTLTSNFVEWFERASVEYKHVRPSLPANAAVGSMLGLALGLIFVLLAVLRDNTISSQTDIEEQMGLTFLGFLPSIDAKAEAKEEQQLRPGYLKNRDLFILDNPKSSLMECARSIRTNVMFMATDKPLNRMLVTSPGPSEGKSTIAMNLSIVMAQAGTRVLLVDTDLRRPRLHRTFGVSGEVGITSVLLKAAKIEEAIKSTDVVGLDILPCGPLPPNPAEIMHSQPFMKLVDELSERYDRIIFDSPPITAVTDAAILAQLVDGVLLVAKAGQTQKDALLRARRNLLGVNANIIGCVVNAVDLESGEYGGYQYYYNRYYGPDDQQANAAS